MSRGTRSRDRQRHRQRAHALLKDVPERYLIDELVSRFGFETGYIHLEVRNGYFLHASFGFDLPNDRLGLDMSPIPGGGDEASADSPGEGPAPARASQWPRAKERPRSPAASLDSPSPGRNARPERE